MEAHAVFMDAIFPSLDPFDGNAGISKVAGAALRRGAGRHCPGTFGTVIDAAVMFASCSNPSR